MESAVIRLALCALLLCACDRRQLSLNISTDATMAALEHSRIDALFATYSAKGDDFVIRDWEPDWRLQAMDRNLHERWNEKFDVLFPRVDTKKGDLK